MSRNARSLALTDAWLWISLFVLIGVVGAASTSWTSSILSRSALSLRRFWDDISTARNFQATTP
jgi:hypothetical protein